MLGYIRPYPPELKLREYEYYRGVYCGVCRAMGHCTGQCSRLALSYDIVFLALIRLALSGGNPANGRPERAVHFEKRRCLVHPLRRRLSLEAGEATDYVACAAAVLNYYKLLDDKTDERGLKRLRAAAALPSFRRFARRAKRHHPALGESVAPIMQRLSNMERDGLLSADEPADAFGEVLAVLFSYGLPSDQARIARHVGHHIGRWLYLVDAIDDYDEDARRGRPNALHRLYASEGLTDERRKHLQNVLSLELRHAADALDLVSYNPDRCGQELPPLIEHMLTIALPDAARKALYPCHDRNDKRKRAKNHDRSI
jgi:hypothetical protein